MLLQKHKSMTPETGVAEMARGLYVLQECPRTLCHFKRLRGWDDKKEASGSFAGMTAKKTNVVRNYARRKQTPVEKMRGGSFGQSALCRIPQG
jgi:hypothetical protein